MQDYPEARTWLKKDKIGNQDIKIRIFLVNAPLTFGHSQLIACFPKGTLYEESERFQLGIIRTGVIGLSDWGQASVIRY